MTTDNSSEHGFSSISKLRLENFKSIEMASLEFAPLTVLIGVNSRGKSTILQSLLVAAQSTSRTQLGGISLNGEAVSLGTSDEVFRRRPNGAPGNQAVIGIEVKFGLQGQDRPVLSSRANRIEEVFFFERKLSRSRKGVLTAVKMVETIARPGTVDQTTISRLDQDLTQVFGRPVFKVSESRSQQKNENVFGRSLSAGASATYYVDFEEARYKGLLSGIRTYRVEAIQLLSWAVRNVPPINMRMVRKDDETPFLSESELQERLAPLAESFYHALVSRSEIVSSLKFENTRYISRVDRAVREWARSQESAAATLVFRSLRELGINEQLRGLVAKHEYLQQQFLASTASYAELDETKEEWSSYMGRQVQYLGPLREKDVVSFIGKSPNSQVSPLGPKAEYLADFIFENKSADVTFPTPSGLRTDKQTYLEALNAWACSYFELGQSIEVEEEGRIGPVLRVDGNRLLHLGTGVSQVLPVIALCIWAKPGSTIILEQPELHLHPGLQQKLGTFLTVVASTGRQVIVETHSEYLLTRVRRHIAEGHVPEESCALVFVQEDGSVVQRPALTGGDEEEWPEQFIDHSLGDQIAIASLRENNQSSD